jgi:hypothetical protein
VYFMLRKLTSALGRPGRRLWSPAELRLARKWARAYRAAQDQRQVQTYADIGRKLMRDLKRAGHDRRLSACILRLQMIGDGRMA